MVDVAESPNSPKPDASKQSDADKASNDAIVARVKAQEAMDKANAPERTVDQRKADELMQKADDARAKAEEERVKKSADAVGHTAAEAKVVLPAGVDPEIPASDVRAVKRGNDPANPVNMPGVSENPDEMTVQLSRVTADSPEPVYCWVHPDMVGNYIRAGWGRGD
jgi:hypothetical protein